MGLVEHKALGPLGALPHQHLYALSQPPSTSCLVSILLAFVPLSRKEELALAPPAGCLPAPFPVSPNETMQERDVILSSTLLWCITCSFAIWEELSSDPGPLPLPHLPLRVIVEIKREAKQLHHPEFLRENVAEMGEKVQINEKVPFIQATDYPICLSPETVWKHNTDLCSV